MWNSCAGGQIYVNRDVNFLWKYVHAIKVTSYFPLTMSSYGYTIFPGLVSADTKNKIANNFWTNWIIMSSTELNWESNTG